MRIISTTVTIIEVADNGQASILESKTTVEKMPETISQKEILTDVFVVTPSMKEYNYISIGTGSRVQIPPYKDINVKSNWTGTLRRRTHKSQKNRMDKMKDILDGLTVGERVEVQYDSSNNEVTYKKIS